MSKNFHPFHIVDYSPWPITFSCGILSLTIGLVNYFQYSKILLILIGLLITLFSMYYWFKDIINEGTILGYHSIAVQKSLKIGIILFIISEILFFFSFFWAFFHSSLSPSIELGCLWPPKGIEAINIFSIPLLNTCLLLGSGATITWSHHSLTQNNIFNSKLALKLTILLGLIFILVQYFEYKNCSFSITESIFSSIFFVMTGFHGIHVIIGLILLSTSLIRMFLFHFNYIHYIGYEAAIWYWHFVDIVWLFLFICIYWWGSI